jgi:4-diphosphocytidyl-2-C-methyl-D-erythritol kinase
LENITVKAYAKINIGLNVVKKREDGFHNLETVFYQLKNLYDELTFEKANSYELIINNHENLTENNLITSALRLLEKLTGKTLKVKITLTKKIPVGAGLGGGSSDAAVTLSALNTLFNLDLPKELLQKSALQLGSDVPLFLFDYPTIGKSRGEILEKINLKISHPILLINPGIHISTKKAFEKITPHKNNFDYSKLTSLPINAWQDNIVNDFESGIFELYPEIKKIKIDLIQAGALFSLMSGTGSTVYGIFPNLKKAKEAKNIFRDNHFTFIQYNMNKKLYDNRRHK